MTDEKKYSIVPKLTAFLKKELADGKYPVGAKFPSEYELAGRFSINKTTANKIVTALVGENLLLRSVRGGGTHVLRTEPFPKGMLAYVGAVGTNYAASIFKGAVESALTRKYLFTVFTPPPKELPFYLEQLATLPYKGILTCTYGTIHAPPRLPVLYANHEFPDHDRIHHSVNADNAGGAREIIETLTAAGHRQIALFLTESSVFTAEQRQRGFEKALTEAGVPDVKKRFFRGRDGDPSSAADVLPKILKSFPDVTAIVTENDNDAICLLEEIMLGGPSLMKQILVTGFGGITGVSQKLRFATVDQRLYQIGAVGAEKLIEIIEEGEPETPVRELLKCRVLHPEFIRSIPSAGPL